MIVDYQAHWYPPAVIERLLKRKTYPRAERVDRGILFEMGDQASQIWPAAVSDLDGLLAEADAAGIDALVIGPSTLGEVWDMPGEEAAELLDVIHAEYAAAQREHAGRILAIGALPLHAPDIALGSLERVASEFGLHGISVLSSNDSGDVTGEHMIPLYARMAELGFPVFLHPGFRTETRFSNKSSFRAEGGIAWLYETARVALGFVDNGILDAVPDLVVVHPHLGGVLPYVAGRVASVPGGKAGRPLHEYLATRFYTDVVSGTPLALPLALDMYGRDRVLFGTDAPFVPMKRIRDFVGSSLEADDVAQIYANRIPGLEFN